MRIPRIRSESPAFDLHHPEVAAIEMEQNEAASEGGFADAPDMEGRGSVVGDRTGAGPDSTDTTDQPRSDS